MKTQSVEAYRCDDHSAWVKEREFSAEQTNLIPILFSIAVIFTGGDFFQHLITDAQANPLSRLQVMVITGAAFIKN